MPRYKERQVPYTIPPAFTDKGMQALEANVVLSHQLDYITDLLVKLVAIKEKEVEPTYD